MGFTKNLGVVLVLCIAVFAFQSAAENVETSGELIPNVALRSTVKERNRVDQFSLGTSVAGAMPVYTHQNTIDYDGKQKQVSVDIDYPAPDADSDDDVENEGPIITKVELYVEGSDGCESQAYVLNGGIGERTISLKLVANNTDILNYTLIVYGQRP